MAPTIRSRTCRPGGSRSPRQNHGFAVAGPNGETRIEADEPVRWETDFGAAELSHLNLYDRTVEGLKLLDVPGGTVQYHPEAGPARTTPRTSSTGSWSWRHEVAASSEQRAAIGVAQAEP